MPSFYQRAIASEKNTPWKANGKALKVNKTIYRRDLKAHWQISKKRVKHVNFKLYRVHPDGVI